MNKIIDKLDDYFDLSKKKQKKKHDKLIKIISRLEEKKSDIKKELIKESEADETGERYNDLSKELKIVSQLIKKAKKHDKPK